MDETISKLLGMIMVETGSISANQLAEALNYQERNGGFLGEIMIQLGYIDNISLEQALKKQKKLMDSNK